MTIKNDAKFDRYVRIIEACKNKVVPCDVLGDMVFIGTKAVMLDCRVLRDFGYLQETAFKVAKLGRPTKHYTTIKDSLDFKTYELMVKETAKFWAKSKKPVNPRWKRNANKDALTVEAVIVENLEPLYRMFGLYPIAEFQPLPTHLFQTYDINDNKEKVNEAQNYDKKQSPRVYVGCSFNQVGW